MQEDVCLDCSQCLKYRTTTITPSQFNRGHFFTEIKPVIMPSFYAVFLIIRPQSVIDSSYYSSATGILDSTSLTPYYLGLEVLRHCAALHAAATHIPGKSHYKTPKGTKMCSEENGVKMSSGPHHCRFYHTAGTSGLETSRHNQ